MDTIKGILFIIIFMLLIVGFAYLRIEAYDGDISCLFIKCVKVIR